MEITFAPTGQVVDTAFATPQKGTVIAPVGIPYLNVPDTDPPTTPYDGVIVNGGSSLYPIMGGPVYNLSFYGPGGTLKVADFAMESEAAIATAQATIATALNATTAAITLNADGTLGS